MARYKHIDASPRFLAVELERQLLPGTFEHALCRLIDHEIDLTGFDAVFFVGCFRAKNGFFYSFNVKLRGAPPIGGASPRM